MSKDGHTTIRVRNEVAEKLRKIQNGTNLTLSDIIENSIKHIEGAVNPEVENIFREETAVMLHYFDANTSKTKPVTFRQVINSTIGDTFNANNNITATDYSTEVAEVIFKDKDSAILRIAQIESEENEEISFQEFIVHLSLF